MNANQRRKRRRHALMASKKAGMAPGSPVYVGVHRDGPIQVRVIDYDADSMTTVDVDDTAELRPYLSKRTVTWINLDGVHEVEQVQALCRTFNVHPLWIEDIVNTKARPKADEIDGQVLVITRMLQVHGDGSTSDEESWVEIEQVSMVMGEGWVLTFQERPGDVWESVRQRIQSSKGRVRRMRADYLLYALLDATVDHYFVALEAVEARADAFEVNALDPTKSVSLRDIFALKGEVADFRRAVWPMRETINGLLRSDGPMSADVLPYVRDLYDHIVQVMDIIETSRERIVGVYELHIAVAGHRLNDIMKILTIVSTIFIPMTFIAGVYGMNFDHMPELHWTWGYAFAWVLMLGVGIGGGVYIVTRKWI